MAAAAAMIGAVEIKINVINPAGETHLAVTKLGGITVRGPRASTPVDAVKNLLWKLSKGYDDDAQVGLEMELAGTSIDQAIAQIQAPGDGAGD